ncbi:MAG TPA: DedA family protein [Thermoanaerobaculia bacterium]|jgi:membrane protein DedA with SNARE-associated domain
MEQMLHNLFASWMQFILDWGYLGIFVMMAFESTALPVPAEFVIPPAAYWASQGKLNLIGVIVAATLGSWAGSALSYWVAWKLGRPLFERYGKYVLLPHRKLVTADDWFAAYGAGGVFVARLLPAVRHLISIPAGLFHMDFKTFSLVTIAGAGLFCTALAWFGQKVLGDQPALMHDPAALRTAFETKSHYLIGFALVVGALYWLMTWMQRRARSVRNA